MQPDPDVRPRRLRPVGDESFKNAEVPKSVRVGCLLVLLAALFVVHRVGKVSQERTFVVPRDLPSFAPVELERWVTEEPPRSGSPLPCTMADSGERWAWSDASSVTVADPAGVEVVLRLDSDSPVVHVLELSPDGRWLAVLWSSPRGTASVFDVNRGGKVLEIPCTGSAAAFAHEAAHVVLPVGDGWVELHDLTEGRRVWRADVGTPPRGVDFTLDDRKVLNACSLAVAR